MEETLLFPSPNWFHVAILKVTSDGYVIYGGPNKSLCVLEPVPADKNPIIENGQSLKAHIMLKAHSEKIVAVDISPDWQNKRWFITGGAEGVVRRWSLENNSKGLKIKPTHSNEYHHREKEELVGVGFSAVGNFAVSVGCFGGIVRWDLQSNVANANTQFMRNFKPVCMACSPHTNVIVAVGTKQGVIFVMDLAGSGKIMYKVRAQDEEIVNVSWSPVQTVTIKKSLRESDTRTQKSMKDEVEKDEIINNETSSNGKSDVLEASGLGKDLPNDTFDTSHVSEDDIFDIYKDHAADEFGHKKYVPEEIIVKTVEELPVLDYLTECEKLKKDILKNKKDEESIQSLVDAFDKTHVDSNKAGSSKNTNANNKRKTSVPHSEHIHKNLLASISKYGIVRIWSKSGKSVGSCIVPVNSGKNTKNKGPSWPTLLWYKMDKLLLADGKNQLLECNPLKIDCKNRIEWRVIHSYHQRSLYCIASEAPRVFKPEMDQHWPIWTISQDRLMIKYCLETQQILASYPSCGGFVYMIQACPYDAGKIAMCVGDGAVRVWQTSMSDDDTRLSPGRVSFYWQNVQGKVLKIAWHPSRENCLAFSTAEARVGLIDTSGKGEKAARTLMPALNGGVYALSWADGDHLYACGGGDLVIYRADRKYDSPELVQVEVDGQRWEFSECKWYAHALVAGGTNGAVAVLTPTRPHHVRAATFVFSKMIYTIEWHPQQTSSSNEESAFKNLMAVCSMDKQHSVAIVEFGDKEDNTKQLTLVKMLYGHKAPIFDVAWNPHRDAQLVSSSADGSIRVWDAVSGVCQYAAGSAASSLCAAWSAFPQLAHVLLTGGGDFSAKILDARHHPVQHFDESTCQVFPPKKIRKKLKEKKETKKKDDDPQATDEVLPTEEQVAATMEVAARPSRRFLFPMISKQMNFDTINAARKLYIKHMCKRMGFGEPSGAIEKLEYDCDYLKIFGPMNEVNDALDKEMARHLTAGNMEQWVLISIFRGHIDTMIQYAIENDLLDPFLVSVAPTVSFKYWKEVTQAYVAQIDRVQAKGEEYKLCENKHYGGALYRKVVALLTLHDVKGAVTTLKEAFLYKEAYILCRIRYMDSIAEEILKEWAQKSSTSGSTIQATVCYLVLGNLVEAAKTLAKTKVPDYLALAIEMAKLSEQPLLAEHIEKKLRSNDSIDSDDNEESLEELPQRAELLMNGSSNDEDSHSDSVANEDSGLDE